MAETTLPRVRAPTGGTPPPGEWEGREVAVALLSLMEGRELLVGVSASPLATGLRGAKAKAARSSASPLVIEICGSKENVVL